MGRPRIHGELLKLGFEIAELTVSKYMIRRRTPSQTGGHSCAISAWSTLTFECLFAFVVGTDDDSCSGLP